MTPVAFGRVVHELAKSAHVSADNGSALADDLTNVLIKHTIAAVVMADPQALPIASVTIGITMKGVIPRMTVEIPIAKMGVSMSIADPKRDALIAALTFVDALVKECGDILADDPTAHLGLNEVNRLRATITEALAT